MASPVPFYWSTAGYGVMFHTFRKGKYDFDSKRNGEVILSHSTDYLDVFFMVNNGAVALLNDYYQLTGNPVLLPNSDFTKGISMPITVIIGKKMKRVFFLKMANVALKVRRITAV